MLPSAAALSLLFTCVCVLRWNDEKRSRSRRKKRRGTKQIAASHIRSKAERKFFALKLDIKVASALKIVTCISCFLSLSLHRFHLSRPAIFFLKLHTQLASEKCRSLSWLSALFRLPMPMSMLLFFFLLFLISLRWESFTWIRCVVEKPAKWTSQAEQMKRRRERSSANSRERHINCQLLRIAGVKCGWMGRRPSLMGVFA